MLATKLLFLSCLAIIASAQEDDDDDGPPPPPPGGRNPEPEPVGILEPWPRRNNVDSRRVLGWLGDSRRQINGDYIGWPRRSRQLDEGYLENRPLRRREE